MNAATTNKDTPASGVSFNFDSRVRGHALVKLAAVRYNRENRDFPERTWEALLLDMLWTDFLNSIRRDWRGSGRTEDRLDDKDWVAAFVSKWGLRPPAAGAAEIAALKNIRAMLMEMLQPIASGVPMSADQAGKLNRLLSTGTVVRRLVPASEEGGYRLDESPAANDWPGVVAEIAASFARTLTDGSADRIRICENKDCRWVFLDDTRNRTKRYCDDKLCGNLMKVRRFRSRHKPAAEGSSAE